MKNRSDIIHATNCVIKVAEPVFLKAKSSALQVKYFTQSKIYYKYALFHRTFENKMEIR